jgi:F-type H+-transporting ATPase subunit b
MKLRDSSPVLLGVLGALVVVFMAAPALAAEGEAAGFMWGHWLVSLVNLAIVIGIIYKFGGSFVTEFFEKRRATLVKDIEEARRLREEAEARLEEYTARLDALEDERKSLLEEYHQQGEREKERIIADAKRQVEKMRADAEITIEQEVKKAVAGLERQVVDLAVEMTEQLSAQKLDAAKQKQLVDDYVGELAALEDSAAERAA